MSKNPSYARFEYTYKELLDCLEHIQDDITNNYAESMYRAMLVDLCKHFVEEYDNNLMGFDDDESEDE